MKKMNISINTCQVSTDIEVWKTLYVQHRSLKLIPMSI